MTTNTTRDWIIDNITAGDLIALAKHYHVPTDIDTVDALIDKLPATRPEAT